MRALLVCLMAFGVLRGVATAAEPQLKSYFCRMVFLKRASLRLVICSAYVPSCSTCTGISAAADVCNKAEKNQPEIASREITSGGVNFIA